VATLADTQSTQTFDRRDLDEDRRAGRRRYYLADEHRRAQRARYGRRRIGALAIAVAVGGLIGAGTYFVVDHHVSQTQQSAAGQTQSAAKQSPPTPQIPSSNNAGNMGTGDGPTQIVYQTPAGNTGHTGTGGAPVG
jgi:hypothetical protein